MDSTTVTPSNEIDLSTALPSSRFDFTTLMSTVMPSSEIGFTTMMSTVMPSSEIDFTTMMPFTDEINLTTDIIVTQPFVTTTMAPNFDLFTENVPMSTDLIDISLNNNTHNELLVVAKNLSDVPILETSTARVDSDITSPDSSEIRPLPSASVNLITEYVTQPVSNTPIDSIRSTVSPLPFDLMTDATSNFVSSTKSPISEPEVLSVDTTIRSILIAKLMSTTQTLNFTKDLDFSLNNSTDNITNFAIINGKVGWNIFYGDDANLETWVVIMMWIVTSLFLSLLFFGLGLAYYKFKASYEQKIMIQQINNRLNNCRDRFNASNVVRLNSMATLAEHGMVPNSVNTAGHNFPEQIQLDQLCVTGIVNENADPIKCIKVDESVVDDIVVDNSKQLVQPARMSVAHEHILEPIAEEDESSEEFRDCESPK